jgi:hypothetical protein
VIKLLVGEVDNIRRKIREKEEIIKSEKGKKLIKFKVLEKDEK